jgi:hypothetical protein
VREREEYSEMEHVQFVGTSVMFKDPKNQQLHFLISLHAKSKNNALSLKTQSHAYRQIA